MSYLRYFRHPFSLILSLLIATPVLAHTVQMSGDVGAIFHIDPNDSPQVGKSSRAWFALTHRSGRPIPLSECNCTLEVYEIPHQKSGFPLFRPTLIAVQGDRYQGIPGADITFPHIGQYELILKGYPKKNTGYNGRFTPFTLTYKVLVVRN